MAETAVHAETGAAQKTSEAGNASDAKAVATEQAEKPLTRTELTSILSEFRQGVNGDIRKAIEKPAKKEAAKEEDDNAKYRRELDAIKAENLTAKKESEVRKAIGGITFFDTEDVVSEITKKIQQRENGTFFVPVEEALEKTGDKVTNEVSIAEAVKDLARRKPHWVKATTIKPGVGAEQSKGGVVGVDPTYEEMMANPKLMGSMSIEDVTRIQNAAFAKAKR